MTLKVCIECKSQLEDSNHQILSCSRKHSFHQDKGCCRKFSPFLVKLYYSAERNSGFMVRQNVTKCNQYTMHPGEHRPGF